MDFFFYKGSADYEGLEPSLRVPEPRSDVELLDEIRNVKTEDLDLLFPEPRLDLEVFDSMYPPSIEGNVSIAIPQLLPTDALPLKEEPPKLVIESPEKVKAKRKRSSPSAPLPSSTCSASTNPIKPMSSSGPKNKPKVKTTKSVVRKKKKVTRSLKRAKANAAQESLPLAKRKKSHKRQRVSSQEKSRLKTEYDRFLHYRNKALLVKSESREKDGCLCPFPGCSYKSERLEQLKDHMEHHKAGQKRYFRCTECNEVFYSSGCLTSHAITHSRGGSTNFCCPSVGCGKRYATAEGLRLHTRNHHQVNKTWKCMAEKCDISFVRKSDLQMHIIRMHSKERPYPCTQQNCSKSFACHSELRRHLLKIHQVECPKLPKDGSMDRPKSDVFERLISEASIYRDGLRKQRAIEKARLLKERKALLRLQKAAAREAKRAAKKKANKQKQKQKSKRA